MTTDAMTDEELDALVREARHYGSNDADMDRQKRRLRDSKSSYNTSYLPVGADTKLVRRLLAAVEALRAERDRYRKKSEQYADIIQEDYAAILSVQNEETRKRSRAALDALKEKR